MLELRNIVKDYGEGPETVHALRKVSLTFEEHGFVTILGPSGCGKTTLLNIIGGLDQYTDGDLIIENKSTKTFNDRDWDSYRNHRVGFVFQSYNLIPHLSVLENVELSLVLNGTDQKERRRAAKDALRKVGLTDQEKKRPSQMSGGQMQRVAIARAIVNNPDIIMADEPTGALDSETSVQVMNILKAVSKDKLVIMVTHNTSIANEYSDRIITLKDGEIVSDSANISVREIDESLLEKDQNSRTSMGISTALKLSVRNLKAKKGRTMLSSFAGAIGIIGVALVLAMSNGFQNYIDQVEGRSVNSIPVTIQVVGQREIIPSLTNMPPQFPKDDNINVYNTNQTAQYEIHYNKFSKEYLDYVQGAVTKGLAQSVLVNYGSMKMNLLASYKSGSTTRYAQVNELANTGMSSINSTLGLPSSIYHELYGDEKFITASYDVLAGKYPQNANEIVLIVDSYNRISVNVYNALGLGNMTIAAGDSQQISFDRIINETAKFRAVYNHHYFTEVTDNPAYASYCENVTDFLGMSYKQRRFIGPDVRSQATLKGLYDDTSSDTGIDLKISGIIRMKDNALMSLMPPSIGYTRELKEKFLERSLIDTPIADAVADNAILRDVQALIDAIIFSETNVNPNPSKYCAKDEHGDPILTDKGEVANPFTRIEQFVEVAFKLTAPLIARDYRGDALSNPNYGLPEEVSLDKTSRVRSITAYINQGLSYGADLTNQFGNYTSNIFLNEVASLMGASLTSSIAVFPSGLTIKKDLFAYLDAWNDTHFEAERIYYMDIAGMVTEGVGIMIEIITIVLVAFASLALLVSSVMTAIITYVSVIERRKEIGVLRALGARKFDVGLLFETETVIIGIISGVIGVIATYVLSIPLNFGLDAAFPGQGLMTIADLPWWYALLLVALSATLTFFAGFIPSQIASKKDPVLSLRDE